jgi:hypothetical protein
MPRYGGVSFIVRVRDEAGRLEAALTSLLGLTVPHDIVVICHLCTDDSRVVAERAVAAGQPVRVFTYDHEVSRAGYETLVTPHDHPASFVSFMNWCYAKAEYAWVFKWDADFVASSELLSFLNDTLDVHEAKPVSYRIGAELAPGVVNSEKYLSNCVITFYKYVFWEVPSMAPNEERTTAARIYSIPPSVLKEYWSLRPWFLADTDNAVDAEIRARYDAVVALCGKEPVGLARASNPECDVVWRTLMAHKTELETVYGLQFYK